METIKISKYIILGVIGIMIGACDLIPPLDPLNVVRTKYDVDNRFDDSDALNTNTPIQGINVSTNNYQFITASDLHINEYSEPLQLLFDFLDSGNEQIKFLVIAGDITDGLKRQLRAARKQFADWNKLPSYIIAGNHDLYFSWEEYLKQFGSSTYSFEITTPTAKDLIITLESGSGTLGKKQTLWLEQQLKKRDVYRHCIVITHTNFFARPFDTNGIYTKEERIKLMSLFTEYQVSMVITGHAHKEHRVTFGNVNYVTIPALEDKGCMRFEVSENNIVATTIVL